MNVHSFSKVSILATMLLGMGSVEAAPPVVEDAAAEAAQIERGRELFARGESTFSLGRYDSTIELWEAAYALFPASMPAERSELQIYLADVHRRAHEQLPDIEHLRAARRFYTDHLDALAASAPTRAAVEAELLEVEAELAELEAKLAWDEAKLAWDEAARVQTEAEGIQLHMDDAEAQHAEQVRAERELAARNEALAEAEHHLRVGVGVGGSLLGVGVVSLATMAAGLALGANVEREGAAAGPETSSEQFQRLADAGTRSNQIAWASGVFGGMLVISGAALILAQIEKYPGLRGNKSRAQLHASSHGFEVRF